MKCTKVVFPLTRPNFFSMGKLFLIPDHFWVSESMVVLDSDSYTASEVIVERQANIESSKTTALEEQFRYLRKIYVL